MPTPDLSTARWRKSSRSNTANNSSCVEIALLTESTAVRDSKNPAGSALTLPNTGWHALLATVKD